MADIYLTKTFQGFAARELISDATAASDVYKRQESLGLVRANGAVIGY